jgi:hypothetical protein
MARISNQLVSPPVLIIKETPDGLGKCCIGKLYLGCWQGTHRQLLHVAAFYGLSASPMTIWLMDYLAPGRGNPASKGLVSHGGRVRNRQ